MLYYIFIFAKWCMAFQLHNPINYTGHTKMENSYHMTTYTYFNLEILNACRIRYKNVVVYLRYE